MQRRLVCASGFLLAIFLCFFAFVDTTSCEPVLIHVEGAYTSSNAGPSSTATPSYSTPTPTTIASNDNPAESTTPTPTPSNTPNPTVTPTLTSQATPNPTYPTVQPTPSPTVPELTLIIAITALGLATALAVFIRKHGKHLLNPKQGAVAAKMLIAALMFALITYAVHAQTLTALGATPPNVSYSLWFTNGTAFPTDGKNAEGYVNGGQYVNVGGIHCIASGFGSSAPKMTNVVVLRNDGDTPINVSLALKNAVAPSDIQIDMYYFFMNNKTFQPYSNQWMGTGDVGNNPLATEQYMWLGITVALTQPDVPTTGTPNYSFDYSFDIEITATQEK